MKEKLIHYAIQIALYCLESPKIRTFILTTFLRNLDIKKTIQNLKKKDHKK